jgi:hypothetical protein
MALSQSQQQVMQQITDYGVQHGFSNEQIAIAIKTAYIESSLGANMGSPLPTPDNQNPTASGLFQYTNETWSEVRYSGLGVKNNIDNQIVAFYADLATYCSWYSNPATNGNIPLSQIDMGEYIYIKHHDGRNYNFNGDPAGFSEQ